MDAELNKQIEQLEDENYSLKAEIERLRDLQSPDHARLWDASKAAMQAALSGKDMGDGGVAYFRQEMAKDCVSVARALIAEVDGSPTAPITVISKGAKNEPGSGPVPQREAPEGVRLWEPDAKGDGDFDFAQLGQKGAEDVATALLMSSAATSTHEIDGENFKVTVVATLGEGVAVPTGPLPADNASRTVQILTNLTQGLETGP